MTRPLYALPTLTLLLAASLATAACDDGNVNIDDTGFCYDTDEDGVCDEDDTCVGDDAAGDPDGDGRCGEADLCEGDDETGDDDQDGLCNDTDPCLGDNSTGDQDSDGVCDDQDACVGDDAAGDRDLDGFCDDTDDCVQIFDPEQDLGTCGVVFVNPGATGRSDGSTWADGFADLQAAVDAAVSRGEPGAPHQVWLVEGTYRAPAANQPVLTLPEGLVLRGGYATDSVHEADRSTRPTVLSGDYLGNDTALDLATVEAERDAPDQPTRTDNAPTVVIMASGTTLDHVDVTGGYATDVRLGVGIAVPAGSVDVMIRGVSAHGNIGAVYNANGGGLGAGRRADLELRDSRFFDNIAWNGAGVELAGVEYAVVDHVDFVENGAMSQGAGLYLGDGRAQIDHCTFVRNRIEDNSGVALVVRRSPGSVSNALFYGNVGPTAVQIDPSVTFDLYSITLADHAAYNDQGALRGGPGTRIWNSVLYGNEQTLMSDSRLHPGHIVHTCSDVDLAAWDRSNRHLSGLGEELGSPFSEQDPEGYFLAQTQAGDPYTSTCVDAGDNADAAVGFPLWRRTTTRADGVLDGETDGDPIDLGYHHWVEGQ